MRYLLCNGHNLKRRFSLCLFTNNAPVLVLTRYKSVTMKYLNVAEKNDAAKNIALHLSRGTSRRREGFSQYNKIYEFEAEVHGQKAQMVMTSVSGHLLALEFVGQYKQWQGCSPLALFDAPVFKYCPENYENIKKTLEREVRSCQGLIIWTDCDREGENIGFEIIQVCTAVKNNLQIFRAKFSEITAVSVRRALNNLEQPNKNISDAVDVRQELDLRIGAAFTRFQTLRLQRVFPSKLAERLVSYGSCQFPTLGFVVERYRAVESFVPETFWKIKVNHTMNNLSVDFNWERVRLFDREACQVLHDICMENPQATVVDVKTKPKSKWRPLPLDTVELEKLASRKLKINAKETMRLAEKLYTQGLISYPRTETNEFPKEMDLRQLVGLHVGDPNWGTFAQGILDGGGPNPRQGNKSDKAHPPIHPTKYVSNLSGNEQRLYEFIVRSFLACCSKDAQGQETTASIVLGGEKFSANGLMITHRNYLDVYPYDKWSSKEIHVYENGQTFTPTSIDLVDGSTSPPNLLTEADLIALMEKHGIGTDATHAEHIETIKNRSYVALADAIHFVPGLLGMGLVEGYDAMGLGVGISKPHLRAQLEADLKDISEGRKLPAQVLAEQIAIYKEVYQQVAAEANKIDAALAERFAEQPVQYQAGDHTGPANVTPALKCPKCGSDMVVRPKKNSDEYFITCLSFPNCKNAVWFPSIVKTVTVLPESCPTCGPTFKKLKFEWRNNSISHIFPPPHIGCLGGCDSTFLEYMQIHPNTVRNVPDNRTQSSTQNTLSRQNSTQNTLSRPNSGTQNTLNRQNSSTQNTSSRQNSTQNTSNRQSSTQNTSSRQNSTQNTLNRQTNSTQSTLNFNTQNSVLPSNTVPVAPMRTTQVRPANPRSNTNTGFVPPPVRAGGLPGADPDDNSVLCGCNKTAILLTVRKQNANQGKKFYKCPVGKENGGCDFFLWAPENAETTQSNTTTNPDSNQWGNSNNQWGQSQSGANSGWGQSGSNSGWGIARSSAPGNDVDVNCDCGMPCKLVTVHKEGPNKGRQFYSCVKDYNLRCKFFQWADTGAATNNTDWGTSTSTSSRGTRGRGRGRGGATSRGGASGGTAAGRGGRKCGLCKQEGHTRARCPNAGTGDDF